MFDIWKIFCYFEVSNTVLVMDTTPLKHLFLFNEL